MMTDPASAIRREVHHLVEIQIESFKQDSSLTASQLLAYHGRSDEITRLYSELDVIAKRQLDISSVRASEEPIPG